MSEATPMEPELDGPELVTASDLVNQGDLPGALRALDRSLGGIAYRMDRKFGRNLVVMILGLLLLFTIGGVAISASHSASTAKRALSSYKAETMKARVGACEQFNKQQDSSIAKDIALSHDFVEAISSAGGTRQITPEARALIDAYNRSHDDLIRQKTQKRDCSEAGIAEYLRGVAAPSTVPAKP